MPVFYTTDCKSIYLDLAGPSSKMANYKEFVRDAMRSALEAAASERYPGGFHINEQDFEKFINLVEKEIEVAPPQDTDGLTQLHLICSQAQFPIHIYPMAHVKKGAAIGGGTGAVLGAAGGTAGGVAAGALIGSVVPIAGTIVGGVIGGIIGFFGGTAVGGGVGAGVGAGGGYVHGKNLEEFISASEVFVKFENYSCNSDNTVCHGTLTVDPSFEEQTSSNSRKSSTSEDT
mgnify:CR=1 FL=1